MASFLKKKLVHAVLRKPPLLPITLFQDFRHLFERTGTKIYTPFPSMNRLSEAAERRPILKLRCHVNINHPVFIIKL